MDSIAHFPTFIAPTSIEARSVLDMDVSGDGPQLYPSCRYDSLTT